MRRSNTLDKLVATGRRKGGEGYGALPGDDGPAKRGDARRGAAPIEGLLGNVRETLLPTLQALSDLEERGVVLDGGYPSGKRSIMLVVEADSEEGAADAGGRARVGGGKRGGSQAAHPGGALGAEEPSGGVTL